MYGTIFAMEVKEGHKQALLGEFNNQGDPNGMVAWLIMQPDNDDTHMKGFAVFKDKETYQANANNPEQHTRFVRIMEHLVGEPSWTDGEYITGNIS